MNKFLSGYKRKEGIMNLIQVKTMKLVQVCHLDSQIPMLMEKIGHNIYYV
jgi:hypothetical protein